MEIVGEMLLKFPLANTSRIDPGTVVTTATVDGGEIRW
jgi:hypothetical protein